MTLSKEEELKRNIQRISKLEQDKQLVKEGAKPVDHATNPVAPNIHQHLTEIHRRITEQQNTIQQLNTWLTSIDERLTLILAILAPHLELDADEKELMDLMKASIEKEQTEK